MRLLVVEDEVRLARLLSRGLSEEGHVVDVCSEGLQALSQAQDVAYDVIVLDWMLPDMDGLNVLRAWRKRNLQTPVLMLTARVTIGERVTGLRAGADDYLPKPFAFDELLARLEALHRRGACSPVTLAIGGLRLDVRARALCAGSLSSALTAREFKLCATLLAHAGDVLTRSELLRQVWGEDFDGEPNVVDVYIGYVRRKLAALAGHTAAIETVRGLGYRLRDEGQG